MGQISVITIPLKTEIWQEDVLFKRFETYRNIYNSMLRYELKQFRKMQESEEYKKSKEIIYSAYKAESDKEKKKIKSSEEYKEAADTQKTLLREYGFSEFQFGSCAIKMSEHFKNVVPTTPARMSIGVPMWGAFEKVLFGNGKSVRFKKYDSWTSIVSDGKSGLRIIGEDGKTTKKMDSKGKYYCYYSSKQGKNLRMPLKIDRKDTYLLEMMERDIHTVRLTRKKVNGTYKYYVQLTVTGAPVIKYDKDGNELHTVGTEKMGVYIDTTSITVSTSKGISTIDIRFKNDIEGKIADINRYLDASRRITNAENFNDDGTIKKGIMKDGKRQPLKWKYSNGYKKARNEKANLQRIQAEQRKIRANMYANELMAIGSDIIVNDYPFQAAAMRKKFREEEEKDEKGRYKKKAKAGKAIGENAPAMIIEILDKKLKARGYRGVIKKKLTNIDYNKESYRKFYASELLREIK